MLIVSSKKVQGELCVNEANTSGPGCSNVGKGYPPGAGCSKPG